MQVYGVIKHSYCAGYDSFNKMFVSRQNIIFYVQVHSWAKRLSRLRRRAVRGDTFSAFAMRDIPHYHKQYKVEGMGVYRGTTYKLFKIKYRLTCDPLPRAQPGSISRHRPEPEQSARSFHVPLLFYSPRSISIEVPFRI